MDEEQQHFAVALARLCIVQYTQKAVHFMQAVCQRTSCVRHESICLFVKEMSYKNWKKETDLAFCGASFPIW
jgi:hypothetical protein